MQATNTIDRYPRGRRSDATRAASDATAIVRLAVITAICLIEAALVLGFVTTGFGIGDGGAAGVGPDRAPAPLEAPRPQPGPDAAGI